MARYGVSNVGAGKVSPIVFTEELININIEYNAGYFLVTEPGLYRITAQCYKDNATKAYSSNGKEIRNQPVQYFIIKIEHS